MCGRYYVDDGTAKEIEKLVWQVDEKAGRKALARKIEIEARSPKGYPSYRTCSHTGSFWFRPGVSVAAVGVPGIPERPGYLQCQM